MGQPAGAVCGVDAGVNLELRSSPIMCAIDAGLIIWRFLYYLLSPPIHQTQDPWKARIRTARIRLLRFRFQDEFSDPSRKGDLADLLRNRYVRLVVFAVTLSQVVKLYGYSGIPWTKAFASVYLASFLTIELLVTWHRPKIDDLIKSSEKEDPISSSGADSLSYISIAASVAFTLYFASAATRDAFGRPEESTLRWSGLVVPISGAAFCAPVYLYSVLKRDQVVERDQFQQVILPGFLLILLIALPLFPYFIAPVIERGSLEIVWHDVFTSLMVVAWTGICLKFTSSATKVVRALDNERDRKRMEKGAGVFFLVLNAVTAFLYYRFSYDPRGTQKASWTDNLG